MSSEEIWLVATITKALALIPWGIWGLAHAVKLTFDIAFAPADLKDLKENINKKFSEQNDRLFEARDELRNLESTISRLEHRVSRLESKRISLQSRR